MKRIIIAGGRDFNDYEYLSKSVDDFINENFQCETITIVSGNARGADKLGERYARKRGYIVEKYPADWDKYGKAAGFINNEQMISVSDGAIMFWDGSSRGTKHSIELARKKGLICDVKMYNQR